MLLSSASAMLQFEPPQPNSLELKKLIQKIKISTSFLSYQSALEQSITTTIGSSRAANWSKIDSEHNGSFGQLPGVHVTVWILSLLIK